MEVPGPGADAGGQVIEALESVHDEVDDLARAVDAALDEEEDAVAGDGAVALVGPGVDDEVGGAGLVLEGDEDDAQGGGGALADEDHAGDGDPCVTVNRGAAEEAKGGLYERLECFGSRVAEAFIVAVERGRPSEHLDLTFCRELERKWIAD